MMASINSFGNNLNVHNIIDMNNKIILTDAFLENEQ
jgi:hypothetical protein